MSQVNKDALLGAYGALWSRGDPEAIENHYTSDYVWHGPGGQEVRGHGELRQTMEAFRSALPDLSLENQHLVAEGDMVASRWTASGTHNGDFMGTAPTGKTVRMTLTIITRFVDGKLAEEWEDFDQYLMLQQIGALPA